MEVTKRQVGHDFIHYEIFPEATFIERGNRMWLAGGGGGRSGSVGSFSFARRKVLEMVTQQRV